MCVDALGRPLRFILTGGQRNDCTKGLELIEGFRPSHVLADKGYDSQEILDAITAMKAVAVFHQDPIASSSENTTRKSISAETLSSGR
jgi:transposase